MLKFELVTLDGIKFGEEVYEVMLPTPLGQIAILPHHIPLVSLAATGVIAIRRKPTDNDERLVYFASNGGVVEILDNLVRLLVDEADHIDEIDEREVREALKRAQQLQQSAKNKEELSRAVQLADLHATRLKVAEIRRHRKIRH